MTNENNHEYVEALKKNARENFEKLDPKEREEWMETGRAFFKSLAPIFLRHLIDYAKKNGYEDDLYNEFALMLQEDYGTFADVIEAINDTTIAMAKTEKDPKRAKELKLAGVKLIMTTVDMYEGDFPDAFDPGL